MKKFLSLVLSLALTLALVACGGGSTSGGSTSGGGSDTASSSNDDMKGSVAMVLSGLVTDEAFNQYTYEGMLRAADEKGIKTAFREEVSQDEQLEVIRQFAQQGYSIIIGQGGQFGDALAQVADEFPDTQFIFSVGSETYGKPNLSAATVSYREAGYLGGIMAALTTKTNKVGMITGVFYANQSMMRDAFEQALKSVNPDIEFVTNETNDWADTDTAYNVAKAMITDGCDVLFPCLDAAGAGVAAAVDDSENCMLVGSVADYATVYNCKNVVGSVDFNWEGLGYLESCGDLCDGQAHEVGMANDGVSAIFNDISDDALAAVKEAMSGLANGTIVLG